MKKWLKYLVYIVAILAMNYLRNYFGWKVKLAFNATFTFDVGYYVLDIIVTIAIGALLGVENFVNELRKEGNWKINIPKLLLMGTPSLYFASSRMLLNSAVPILWNIARPMFKIATTQSESFFVIFQVILGYIIITSFYKEHEVKKIEPAEIIERVED